MKSDRTEMMCGFTMKERKKSAELRELLGLDTVNLVIKKGRLRLFGHVEWKDDADWTLYNNEGRWT